MYKLIFFFCFISGCSFSQEQFSIYFETNKFNLKVQEQDKLNQWTKDNPKVKILAINGYTDEDGSIGLNDTLSLRRVQTVFKNITGKVAIRDDFKTRSFGKLHQHDTDKAKNRRATIFYLLEKDLDKEDEILGIKKEILLKEKPKYNYPEILELQIPGGKSEKMVLDTVFMSKLSEAKAGDYVVMKNLNFVLNTFAVVKESVPKLYELLLVMQQNPDLVIEIHGHICCNPKDFRDLSTQRAKAIKQFLVGKGIDASRVSFKGFGSTKPKYPLPENNEFEASENRRVEIFIVKN
jgi:outer membrane protein OmpA-like peptidoglycan-associated protein